MAHSTGYFEIYESLGQWRWRFKSNNDEIIASGESYFNKQDCLNAIGLMKGSYNAEVYEA
jgi:uncharacterized protein